MRRAPLGLAFALAAASPAVALAQGGAPTPTAAAPDATGFAYRYVAGVDGNLALGIVDRYLVTVRGDALVTTPTVGLFVEPRYTYANINARTTDSEWYLRMVGFLYPRAKYYGFVVGLGERSFRRKYEYRVTGGAGVGTNLVNRPLVQILFAQGLAYEQSRFKSDMFEGHPEIDDRDRGVVRAVTRASGRLKLNEKSAFFYDLYLKPSVTHITDYRILGKATFELAIAGKIVARAILDYTRESVRVVGTSADELMVSFGFAVRKD